MAKKHYRKADFDVRLFLEELESRLAPAAAPAWQPLGPAPQTDPDGLMTKNDVSGRVTALAVSRNYNGAGVDALFAGTAGGGIWRETAPAGNNPVWQQVSDKVTLPGGGAVPTPYAAGLPDIGALAVDPVDGHHNIIYAGTGEANFSSDSRYGTGVLKSTDGGDNWTLIALGVTPAPPGPPAPGHPLLGSTEFYRESISKILVTPVAIGAIPAESVYMSVVPAGDGGFDADVDTDLGVYRSTDGGRKWDKLPLADPHQPLVVTDLEYTNVNGRLVLYAGVANPYPKKWTALQRANNGIWESTDGGSTWTHLGGAIPPVGPPPFGAGAPLESNNVRVPPTIGRIALAADNIRPGANPVVYALVAEPDETLQGFYSSVTNGASWTQTGIPYANFLHQGTYDLAVGVDPANPSIVYVGGQGNWNVSPVEGVLQSVNGGKAWFTISTVRLHPRRPAVPRLG